MSPDPRRGMKLIDLMVAVFVVAIGTCLLLPFLHDTRTGCGPHCSNNLRQLGLGLLNFSTAHNHFPNAGTFREDPSANRYDPLESTIYRSIVDPGRPADLASSWLRNWVVDIMPYLDQPDIANAWDESAPYWWPTQTLSGQPANGLLSSTRLGILRCPTDHAVGWDRGELSYVVNGGFVRWPAVPVGWRGEPADGQSGNGGVQGWVPPGRSWLEAQAVCRKLGVMFPGTEAGDHAWDIKTTPADLSDGASETLLLAENTLAGSSDGTRHSGGRPTNWACPLPNFCMFLASDDVCWSARSTVDCLGGQLAPLSPRRDGPGWSRANLEGTFEKINDGRKLTVKGSFPYANSVHPGGANFAFCDGAVRFLTDSIDGTVYAKIVTPAGGRLPAGVRQGALARGAFDE